ncbi:MAG: GTP cyclohydrolase I, partial [Myxococcota bacterium]
DVEDYRELVVVRGIAVESHCEHHMLPIRGHAHLAYLPVGRVVGLSKLARLVDAFARRLQTQERMTMQIAQALQEELAPRGSAVLIEAEHACMSRRGIRALDSLTVTQAFTGELERNASLKREFLELVRKSR